MYKYTVVQGSSRAAAEACRAGQWREGVLITARRAADMCSLGINSDHASPSRSGRSVRVPSWNGSMDE